MSIRTRQFVLAAVAALGGLALFTYTVRQAGVDAIVEGVWRVGWGLVPILVLAGLRFVVRTEAWRQCAPPGARLPFIQALLAFLAGDAVGNVTPAGLVASEPTKVYLTRHHLATRAAISSLAVDNLIYAGSVLAMVGAGVIVTLVSVSLPSAWKVAALALLTALAMAGGAAFFALRLEAISRLRRELANLVADHPLRLWRVLALDMTFHALAVLEVFYTLELLLGASSPTLRQAFIFEALNRAITVAFKFVPLLAGVDEAVSSWFGPVVGVNPTSAVSLAVVRKVRKLFWAGIGLALMGVHHVQAAPATDRRGNARVRRT